MGVDASAPGSSAPASLADPRHVPSFGTKEQSNGTFGSVIGVGSSVALTHDLGGALGIAPGIPGGATKNGTAISAIAIAQFGDSSAELDAFTILHEMGHFAGLSHTTEYRFDGDDGGLYDPLPDTPACDGGVGDIAKRCPDYTNVMFPGGDQETGLLSTAQVRVLRGSPVYRAKASGPIVAPPRRPLPRLSSPSNLPGHVGRCRIVGR